MFYVVIDSNDIVLSVNDMTIDPVETKKSAEIELEKNTEYKLLVKEIHKLSVEFKKTKNTEKKKSIFSRMITLKNEIDTIYNQYLVDNKSYTNPAPKDGTPVIIDTYTIQQVYDLFENRNSNLLFYRDGEFGYIENTIGRKYYYQDVDDEWVSYVTSDISEVIPSEWIYVGDLTEDQKQEIRYSYETESQRESRLRSIRFSEFLNRTFEESPEYQSYLIDLDTVPVKDKKEK